jgi:flavin-dependent dehydrogenase
MSHPKPDFDVGIIGGGPAGASMAAYLAKAGVDCVVLERALFPRPHVGESLVPSSTRVFADLGFLDQMERGGFIRKYGAAWTASTGSQIRRTDWEGLEPDHAVDIRFQERNQPGVDQIYTYHVDRGKFDNLLLHHAEALGAKVYEGVSVKGVDFSHRDHVGITFGLGRRDVQTTARMVVDASGRRTLVGNQMRWRVKDPVFDQYAIHTWFHGYDRTAWAKQESLKDYIFVHFMPITNTWLWQIPITESVTSIGVVTQKKNFARTRESRDRFFWDCIRTRADLEENLRTSVQLRPLKEEGDYSYAMRRLTDDRLVLVGDAARFVDPIFSTGVSIALNSSRFASRGIIDAMETGDLSRQSFGQYEDTIRRGTRNWYNFISVYYRLNVLFTAFIIDPRYRLDILKLLQGDVYDEEEPSVLARMREVVREVEQSDKHMWHHLLGDLTANAFVDAYQSAT